MERLSEPCMLTVAFGPTRCVQIDNPRYSSQESFNSDLLPSQPSV